MKALRNLIAIIMISAAVSGLIACGASESPAQIDKASAGVSLQGAGSTFISPLLWRWLEEYNSLNSELVVDYQAVGSGAGIKQFIAGEVDFGASDAAMNDQEIAQLQPPEGRGVRLIPVAAGEVVVAYNIPGLSGGLALPREVYVDIFLGRITHWDDPRIQQANPALALPARQIQVVARKDSSGTTFAFTNHLSSVSEDWKNGPGTAKLIDWPGSAIVAAGNEGVAQKLKISNYSIGYVEYGFANRLGLAMASLENHAGNFVVAGAESGKLALASAVDSIPEDLRLFLPDPSGEGAYPIVSLVWLLLPQLYPEATVGDALTDMVDWFLTQGQPISADMGYVPLPDNLVSLARTALIK